MKVDRWEVFRKFLRNIYRMDIDDYVHLPKEQKKAVEVNFYDIYKFLPPC